MHEAKITEEERNEDVFIWTFEHETAERSDDVGGEGLLRNRFICEKILQTAKVLYTYA